jgi:hypothetical protein
VRYKFPWLTFYIYSSEERFEVAGSYDADEYQEAGPFGDTSSGQDYRRGGQDYRRGGESYAERAKRTARRRAAPSAAVALGR